MPARIAIVAGTRPEAIKLIPVVTALYRAGRVTPVLIASGQHREMLNSVLAAFDVEPDIRLDVMTPNQTLSGVLSRLMAELGAVIVSGGYDGIVVQGDTTTALAGALAGHYARIPVAHVEAGLRTNDKWAPFPEETHRRMISAVADLHFAATEQARAALTAENISAGVHVVGNTVVDALLAMREKVRGSEAGHRAQFGGLLGERRYILVTGHRRENFGDGMANICQAILDIVRDHPDLDVIYAVHLNPNVKTVVGAKLAGVSRVHLIDPQPYDAMVFLMMYAWLILTDSGGIQEEAPSLDVPLLVMRDKTERPEGIDAGCARLVGTDPSRIACAVNELHASPDAYQRMARTPNPYGDGRAGERIAAVLAAQFAAPGTP